MVIPFFRKRQPLAGAHPEDFILTGPPRSGTTLSCFLLHKLPEVVALHEPMERAQFPDPTKALKEISGMFASSRHRILHEGKARARAVDGKIPDNPFSQEKGRRKSIVTREDISIDKPLKPNFKLGIKQNGTFTYLLPQLTQAYPCYAIIRNPLALLGSWNSLQSPLGRGHLLVEEQMVPAFKRKLRSLEALRERHLHIMDWLYQRYECLPAAHIIRYEDMTRDPGRALEVITADAANLQEKLSNKNLNALYDLDQMRRLAEDLLRHDGAWLHYYDSTAIEELLHAIPTKA